MLLDNNHTQIPAQALRKATRSVRDYHLRIASTEELQKLAYVGPLTAKAQIIWPYKSCSVWSACLSRAVARCYRGYRITRSPVAVVMQWCVAADLHTLRCSALCSPSTTPSSFVYCLGDLSTTISLEPGHLHVDVREGVHCVRPALQRQVVQHKLWSLYPPDPLTEEEQAERNQLKEQAEGDGVSKSYMFPYVLELLKTHWLFSSKLGEQSRTSCCPPPCCVLGGAHERLPGAHEGSYLGRAHTLTGLMPDRAHTLTGLIPQGQGSYLDRAHTLTGLIP
eukprot:145219-Pelagomonas_calceolata.AAC.10